MILIYLVLEQDQFTEYDAHYFPEYAVPISRLSEPKNYSACDRAQGRDGALRGAALRPSARNGALSDDELGREAVRHGWPASDCP